MLLKDLQKQFVQTVPQDVPSLALKEIITESHIPNADRLQIYTRNVHGALKHALSLTYPTCEALVGEAFFAQCCAEFGQKHLPDSGNLDDYGKEFPDFIETYPSLQTLLYLPDLARLEWAFHQTSLTPNPPPMNSEALQRVPVERYDRLHFSLHPGIHLFASTHPIATLWQWHADGAKDTLDLQEYGTEQGYLRRSPSGIHIHRTTHAEHAFLCALQHGNSLYLAFETALNADEQFDLASHLQHHVTHGTFSRMWQE